MHQVQTRTHKRDPRLHEEWASYRSRREGSEIGVQRCLEANDWEIGGDERKRVWGIQGFNSSARNCFISAHFLTAAGGVYTLALHLCLTSEILFVCADTVDACRQSLCCNPDNSRRAPAGKSSFRTPLKVRTPACSLEENLSTPTSWGKSCPTSHYKGSTHEDGVGNGIFRYVQKYKCINKMYKGVS